MALKKSSDCSLATAIMTLAAAWGYASPTVMCDPALNILQSVTGSFFPHTLNGNTGNQIVHFVSSRLQYPLWRSAGIGVEYILYMRNSFFRDFPDVHRRNPELRGGVTFSWK